MSGPKPVAWTSEDGIHNMARQREERRSHWSLQVRVDRRDDYNTVPLYTEDQIRDLRERHTTALAVIRRFAHHWQPIEECPAGDQVFYRWYLESGMDDGSLEWDGTEPMTPAERAVLDEATRETR